jgi:prepilin-type N-terminal cleavage/methylation domain-containing protein
MKKHRQSGFTLIELLISIALMVMLLAAITMVFINTTETVATQEARMTVYQNARYALDIMENDLFGCLSFDTPQPFIPNLNLPPPPPVPLQAFWMENGTISVSGVPPSYNTNGGHDKNSGDIISFRSTTTVGGTIQTCQVTYFLMPGNMTIDPGSPTPVAGDDTHKETVRTQRPLFTLVRQCRTADPKTPSIFDQIPTVMDKGTGSLTQVIDQELCHYVVSYNIEYFADNRTFSQLQPSPCTRTDPLGDSKGDNDIKTPYRIPCLRVTLVIVEDIAERQERVIQKVMWLPQN